MSVIVPDLRGRGEARGRTIFDYADELAIEVPTSCRRAGRCHECIVEIRQGMAALSPRNDAESFLRDPYRLACQAVIELTCRRTSPKVFKMAKSRLRRRPDATINCPSTARPSTASTAASTWGVASMRA